MCEGVLQGQTKFQVKAIEQKSRSRKQQKRLRHRLLNLTSAFPCFPACVMASPLSLRVGQQNCSEHRLKNIGMIVEIKKFDAFITRKIL